MSERKTLGRREFLRLSALATGATMLAACSEAPKTTVPTAQAVQPTAVVKPSTGATPAPQAAQPTAAPAAAAAPKPGGQLIGKLGGPTLVLDPAKLPKKYSEAPALAELVKAGKLPPIEQRLPAEPLVFQPFESIGKYGGTIRRGFSGPDDQWNARRINGPDTFLWMNFDATKIVPNLAKGWEVSKDGKQVTLFLRKGLRWSDGQPFTADDVMFWYEDMYLNKEYNPTPAPDLTINGKPVTLERVDDLTIRFNSPDPYFSLVTVLGGNGVATGGQSLRGLEAGGGGYAPKHYMKQYHPKYATPEQMAAALKQGGFDNWVKLFRARATDCLNPDLPVVAPWRTVTPLNTPQWVLERNPYSWFVDSEGNQLPYIDKLVITLGESLEVINLRAIAGEVDFQARHMDLAKLPVFLENQAKGGYKVYLDPADAGTDAGLAFNLAYDKDPELAKWFNTVDFRRALSLGVDRDQLNEAFWLGTGTPGSVAPAESTIYSPGAQYRKLWHTLDVQKANEMLDKLGLNKKDAAGFRLRADGKRLRIELMTYGGQFMQFTAVGEMISQMYKKIGVELAIQEVERNLGLTKITANEHQLFAWTDDDAPDMLSSKGKTFPVTPGGWALHGNPYATWYASAGKQGTEPKDPVLVEAMDKLRKMPGLPDDERVKIVKELWATSVEQVWTIGTVGLSPAVAGVRIAKTKLGNIPERTPSGASVRNPILTQPATFYWKG